MSSSSFANYSQTTTPDTSGNTIPVWFYDYSVPKFGKLLTDGQSDVVVVGAGIAGLTTAYHLLKEGLTVMVLDDGDIASGESGRTSAHLSNALDDRYFHIAKMLGEQAAAQAAESHSVAIDRIQEIVDQEQIDCEFERVAGYLFKPPGDTSNVLEREYEAARKAGLNVDWVERAPFENSQGGSISTQNPFDTGRCLVFPRQAIFHPVKYLAGLSQAVVRLGGRIYTQTHVDQLEGGPHARIVTSDRVTVKCNAIVQATNQPINDIITMYTKEHAYRTYVIAARVAKGSVTNALFWDTPDVYHYIRLKQMPDFDYLIVGGEDHKVGHAGHNVEEFNGRFRALEEWTRRRFPGVIDVPYRWSGQIMEPLDDMAYIGRNPGDNENVYICTGDSGNGLTHGTIAGILLTDLIMGRQNRWAELYDPSRKNFLKNISDFAHENIDTGLTYKEYLTSGDVQDIEQIPRCSGALIRQGLTKIAVYKDADGSVCKMSAICPHLKSIVQWNELEKSWDCPAHGSRFDRYGKVINGPSNRGLSKISPEKSAI